MKRLLCALLLVLFVGGALGCKAEEEEKPSDPTEPTTGTETTE